MNQSLLPFIKFGQHYQHYKGELYIPKGIGWDTFGQQFVVLYSPYMEPDVMFTRPLNEWYGRVPTVGGEVSRYQWTPSPASRADHTHAHASGDHEGVPF